MSCQQVSQEDHRTHRVVLAIARQLEARPGKDGQVYSVNLEASSYAVACKASCIKLCIVCLGWIALLKAILQITLIYLLLKSNSRFSYFNWNIIRAIGSNFSVQGLHNQLENCVQREFRAISGQNVSYFVKHNQHAQHANARGSGCMPPRKF